MHKTYFSKVRNTMKQTPVGLPVINLMGSSKNSFEHDQESLIIRETSIHDPKEKQLILKKKLMRNVGDN